MYTLYVSHKTDLSIATLMDSWTVYCGLSQTEQGYSTVRPLYSKNEHNLQTLVPEKDTAYSGFNFNSIIAVVPYSSNTVNTPLVLEIKNTTNVDLNVTYAFVRMF